MLRVNVESDSYEVDVKEQGGARGAKTEGYASRPTAEVMGRMRSRELVCNEMDRRTFSSKGGL